MDSPNIEDCVLRGGLACSVVVLRMNVRFSSIPTTVALDSMGLRRLVYRIQSWSSKDRIQEMLCAAFRNTEKCTHLNEIAGSFPENARVY